MAVQSNSSDKRIAPHFLLCIVPVFGAELDRERYKMKTESINGKEYTVPEVGICAIKLQNTILIESPTGGETGDTGDGGEIPGQ